MKFKLVSLLSIFIACEFSEASSSGSESGFGAICDMTTYQLNYTIDAGDKIYPGGSLTIFSDGCPGFNWTSKDSSLEPREIRNNKIVLPLAPKIAKNPIYVGIKGKDGVENEGLSLSIGVAANGVAIFSNKADDNNKDAWLTEGQYFDVCEGHIDTEHRYHFHIGPSNGCIYPETSGKHSPLFGIMYDGIPIYGSLGDNGVVPTDLDECGGHTDNTYSFYHYHIQPDKTFPYTISCLKGCIYNANNNTNLEKYVTTTETCITANTQYNYTEWTQTISESLFKATGVIVMHESASSLSLNYIFILFLICLVF